MFEPSMLLLVTGALVFASVVASKVSDKYGIPALVAFLLIGMLAGSEGPGAIEFDNARVANLVGAISLTFILFSGGLDTSWQVVRPVLWRGVFLSTFGVAITAGLLGLFSWAVLGMEPGLAFLLGAIVSSTDAAAVFSVLRRRGVGLRGDLKPLLEFESGSNDPMALFLTVSVTAVLTESSLEWFGVIPAFAINMLGGIAVGLATGRLGRGLFNRMRLDYEGLYPVLSMSLVLLTFGLAEYLRSNGFIAVYVCGIMMNASSFRYQRTVVKFHDGLAWLMQIILFLVLGLLVFPSELIAVAPKALLAALFLMLAARPVAVSIGLWRSKFTQPERMLAAWTGLRGAVPIVLATFPLAAGYEGSDEVFNVVFFIVLCSVLVQGILLMPVARWLNVDEPLGSRPKYSLEIERAGLVQGETREVEVLPNMAAAGKSIADLDIPPGVLILLVGRGDGFVVPKGETRIEPYDTIVMLGEPGALQRAGDAVLHPRPRRRRRDMAIDPLEALPLDTDAKYLSTQVVVVGYGRVGRRICARLTAQGIPFVIVDQNREIIQGLREKDIPAVLGDASTPVVLAQAHVLRAAMLIVATPDTTKARQMAEIATQINPKIEIVIRSHSEVEANLLRQEKTGVVFLEVDALADTISRFVMERFHR